MLHASADYDDRTWGKYINSLQQPSVLNPIGPPSGQTYPTLSTAQSKSTNKGDMVTHPSRKTTEGTQEKGETRKEPDSQKEYALIDRNLHLINKNI